MKTNSLRKNYQIRWSELMIIDETGNKLGVMKILDAIRLAQQKSLDLVEIVPNPPKGQPAIAKILDYGKYMYEKAKQEKKKSKSPGELEIKTVRIGFKTGKHDLEIKAKKIDNFLEKGHRVIVDVVLRGRENAMSELAKNKLASFIKTISQSIVVEGPKRQPRGWSINLRKTKI